MSENQTTNLHRREALFSMVAGAGLASLPLTLKADEKQIDTAEVSNKFKPTIPFQLPAGTKVPLGLELYGKCNGYVDIIMSDFTPALNKKGQLIDEHGQPVTDPRLAKLSPSKNVLLVGRDLPGKEDYGQDRETGANYGGHYHEEAEVIYCTKGKMKIIIRENSGKEVIDFEGDLVVEKSPEERHGPRKYQVISKSGKTPQFFHLSNQEQIHILERGGMITIPARSFHSVIMLDTGDMVAYLPDGKRWAEQAISSPGKEAKNC